MLTLDELNNDEEYVDDIGRGGGQGWEYKDDEEDNNEEGKRMMTMTPMLLTMMVAMVVIWSMVVI
jgi:hypothetical protein